MQETINHPPVESRRHFPRPRIRSVGNFCLKSRIERPVEARNNDPLAHIYRLAEAQDFDSIEEQIKTEFVTDIAERAKDQHFYGVFEYDLLGNDLISSTGLSLAGMLEAGLEAASGDGITYGIARAEALCAQLPIILDWARSDEMSQLAFFSLAPDTAELDPQNAKKLYFKQDRMMSSNWLFEKSETGVTMHAFSFDNHTLATHHEALQRLGLETLSSATTLDELTVAHYLTYDTAREAVAAVRSIHDEILQEKDPTRKSYYFGKVDNHTQTSANQLIDSCSEGYELYKEAILASFESLRIGYVTPRFSDLIRTLRDGFRGFESPVKVLNKRAFRHVDSEDISELMSYLRSKAIPHYVYGEQGITLAESGASAISRGVSYDGACPSSEQLSPAAAQAAERVRIEAVFYGRPLSAEKFQSQTCPCCLPVAISGEIVRAWRSEGVYGCEDCGHVVDICGRVIRRGNSRIRHKEQEAEKSKAEVKKKEATKPKKDKKTKSFWKAN